MRTVGGGGVDGDIRRERTVAGEITRGMFIAQAGVEGHFVTEGGLGLPDDGAGVGFHALLVVTEDGVVGLGARNGANDGRDGFYLAGVAIDITGIEVVGAIAEQVE